MLDVRPVTIGTQSFSSDQQVAANAVSYGQDDVTGFAADVPPILRTVSANLSYRRDRLLADGALFIPQVMEHKWAMYFHGGQILCIRSWQRRVYVTAQFDPTKAQHGS